jgi:hypothetical protein
VKSSHSSSSGTHNTYLCMMRLLQLGRFHERSTSSTAHDQLRPRLYRRITFVYVHPCHDRHCRESLTTAADLNQSFLHKKKTSVSNSTHSPTLLRSSLNSLFPPPPSARFSNSKPL